MPDDDLITVPRAALGRIIALGTTTDTGLPALDEAWEVVVAAFREDALTRPEPPSPSLPDDDFAEADEYDPSADFADYDDDDEAEVASDA